MVTANTQTHPEHTCATSANTFDVITGYSRYSHSYDVLGSGIALTVAVGSMITKITLTACDAVYIFTTSTMLARVGQAGIVIWDIKKTQFV